MLSTAIITHCLIYMLIKLTEGAGEVSIQTYVLVQELYVRIPANVLVSVLAESKVTCSAYCDVNTQCVVFGYNKLETKCELYSSVTSDNTTSLSIIGWSMYYDIENMCTDTSSSNQPYPLSLTTSRVNMEKANQSCLDDGKKLVKIDRASKMQYIRNVVKFCSNYQSSDYWVDGTNINAIDFLASDAWRFYDGSAVPMTSDIWCPGYPDNADTEHCTRLWRSCAHFLNDKECSSNFGYICEP